MKSKMNFTLFVNIWKHWMVYRPSEMDFKNTMHDLYIHFKEGGFKSVKEFCEFWHPECDLDTHPFMLKSKAFKTKHANGLIEMANKFRSNMGLDPLKKY